LPLPFYRSAGRGEIITFASADILRPSPDSLRL
jgi:hypothetical protein